MMKVETFSVQQLIDPCVSCNPDTWHDEGHAITIVTTDGQDSSKDDLYIDHHHIHPTNWSYIYNRDMLVWHQDLQNEQAEYLGGHIGFDTSRKQGAGSMQFGTQRQTVLLNISSCADDHCIFGSYSLSNSSCLTTHSGKLVVNGKRVESSGVTGNRLWWKDVESQHIPCEGFADFSEYGDNITASSFAAIGNRNVATFTPASSSVAPKLDFLISMNPYKTDSKGNTIDPVQQAAMQDFYKFILYYMPAGYLHDFISANVPDLGPLQAIALDSVDNKAFYESLAVPYLTSALSRSKEKNANKLNGRRAEAKLKHGVSKSSVYGRQAASVYSHEWQKTFPFIKKFISDQQVNSNTYSALIDADVLKWKANLQRGLSQTTDTHEKQQLQQM